MLYDDDNGLLGHTGEFACELLLPVRGNTDVMVILGVRGPSASDCRDINK